MTSYLMVETLASNY